MEPESERQSIEWKHPQSPGRKKFKSQPSAGNLMLTCFWDSQGPALERYQRRDATTYSAHYSEVLTDRLKPAIRTKHRGLVPEGVVLLHDNAETLRRPKFDAMAHAPYSPDRAGSEYHLIGPLKQALRGHQFISDQKVNDAAHAWLIALAKTFFLMA
jgi:hypothetical protein